MAIPSWALNIMLACAKAGNNEAYTHELEALSNASFGENFGMDEVWYGTYPMNVREQPHPLKPEEQWKPIDEDLIKNLFSQEGPFSKIFTSYEPRAGQVAMALEIARSITAKRYLLAEAGTGVGKSLAYLIPCAIWALTNDQPIVVSTNTRNLQSQLSLKDIPLLKKLLTYALPEGKNFKAAVLKGRGNYLCLMRMGKYIDDMQYVNLQTSQQTLFSEFIGWASQTVDGDLETFSPTHSRDDQQFIRSFGCRSDDCANKKCRFYKRCLLFRARQAALQAHIVITNHALVFADLCSEGKLLPPHAQLVFDEAHHIEDSATGALSVGLTPNAVYEICQKFTPSKGHETLSIARRFDKEFLQPAIHDTAELFRLMDTLSEVQTCGRSLANATKLLFAQIAKVFTSMPANAATVRFRCVPDETLPKLPDGQPQYRREACFSQHNFQPLEHLMPESELFETCDAVHTEIGKAQKNIRALLLAIEKHSPVQAGKTPRPEEQPYAEIQAALEGFNTGLDAFAKTLDTLIAGRESNSVYWFERFTIKKETHYSLNMAPMDIAQQLNEMLYKGKASVIFSSATLRIRDNFDNVRSRLGLNLLPKEQVQDFVAESPFNYGTQCQIAVPMFLPDINDKDYVLELSRMIYLLIVAAQGRTLVLFTSYDMMRRCAQQLAPHLAKCDIDILLQDASTNRNTLTETFRANKRASVLFGTQSFWEGVDVVGDALSCVIIARLPFENPSDPIYTARCERVERSGGSTFSTLTLPMAITRFRQGVGRLIRSRQDRGLIVIADTRILTASYSTSFTKALPTIIKRADSRKELVSALKKYL